MEYPVVAQISQLIIEAEAILLPELRKSKLEPTYVKIRLAETPYDVPTHVITTEEATVFMKPDIHRHIDKYDVIIQKNYSSREQDTVEVYISTGEPVIDEYVYSSTMPSFLFLASQVQNILKSGFRK